MKRNYRPALLDMTECLPALLLAIVASNAFGQAASTGIFSDPDRINCNLSDNSLRLQTHFAIVLNQGRVGE